MANWCSNNVQFEADDAKLNLIKIFIEEMAENEMKTNCGQLPSFITLDYGYLFNIRWEENVLYYETKWSSNIQVVKSIADYFKVGFTCYFEEGGMQIFGSAEYRNGNLIITELESEDYDKFSYDETTDLYQFEGETYESDHDILEILLERKTTIINKTTE